MNEARPGNVSPHLNDLSARVLFEAPIIYAVPDRTVHSPMVTVKAREIETKLILDTGSTAHVFTLDLAARARLESRPTDPGTDHTGATVSSWLLGDVAIDLSGFTIELRSVQAIEGPPQFIGWGIGGFLSPQALHPSASVVIDLVRNRLALIECDEFALAAWLKERFPTLHLLSIKRVPGEGVRILVSIEPYGSVVAMLNTGTPDTEVARSALPGIRGTEVSETGFGVSGAEVTGAQVTNRVLRVDEVNFPVPVLFLRDEMPPEHPDAQIGMDVLRGTVLAISPYVDRLVHWVVPSNL